MLPTTIFYKGLFIFSILCLIPIFGDITDSKPVFSVVSFFGTLALIIILLVNIMGCSSAKTKPAKTDEALYNEALGLIKAKKFQPAKQKLVKINEEFPFSDYAKNATVLNIYANYQLKNYAEIPSLAELYLNLYPFDENVPYLLYISGKTYYFNSQKPQRNMETFQKLQEISERIISNYPNTKYAQKALEMRDYAVKAQFIRSLNIADFYHNQDECVGALKRYVELKNRFPDLLSTGDLQVIDKNITYCLEYFGVK
jgi:outer membrane protein assembly factor BamD